jgi:hypothetical protein
MTSAAVRYDMLARPLGPRSSKCDDRRTLESVQMSEWVHAPGEGLSIVSEFHRMALLSAGVLCELAPGIFSGTGGLAGMALLLSFPYAMDPPKAMACCSV